MLCRCFLAASLWGVFLSSQTTVMMLRRVLCDSRKHREQNPCLFFWRHTCWFLFGASRLRVNKNVVPQLSTFFSKLCSRSLQSPQLSEHLLTFLTESLRLIFLFSVRVCSPLMEFRERCSSVCPSHTPSAFTASTCCAGGECCCSSSQLVNSKDQTSCRRLKDSAHF